MNSKPRIGPNGTYIFDEQDLAQLDELSFTTVINEAAHAADLKPAVAAKSGGIGPAEDTSPRQRRGDAKINALLDSLDTGLK